MEPQHDPVDEIFCRAAEFEAAGERAKYLDNACGDDRQLRQRVERLLAAQSKVHSFLESPAPGAEIGAEIGPTMDDSGTRRSAGEVPGSDRPLSEKPGTRIGPYKLLQKLGEGGMGVVYMAEQTEPVERRVALKIIKPGMDTRQVIARFEAERQALAMMDHPNIAHVVDAGTTDSGRPFFAMELVKGVPITEYCDEHQFTVRQRLELFADVCHAVQHAHQKGIIHRDIKPSNVLVAEYDDHAVPKIIDFGVAKAIQARLTDKTMFTQLGQVVGTLEYMSPEQAKLNQLDIDTRSDIYSLGVLLYELLTGETPFDRKRLRSAAFDEMLKIIRDEEPPRPSMRVSTNASLPSIAANRHVEPKKLSLLVRGELDWIVMKAMEKDRARRFDTANAFAADIARYLNDEAVAACPPSAGYRFRKFAHRNKGALAAVSFALVGLLLVTVGSLVAAERFRMLAQHNARLAADRQAALTAETAAKISARDAQLEAERARDHEEELRKEAVQQRERAEANFSLARSAVDEFLNRVTENELLSVPGMQPLRQELLSSAMEFYEGFAQDDLNSIELLSEIGWAHYRIGIIRRELGQGQLARESFAKSIELFERLHDGGQNSINVRLGLALAYAVTGRSEEAVSLCQEILKENPQHARARSELGNRYNTFATRSKTSGDLQAALKYHQQALAFRESLVQDFPDDPTYLAELGGTINNIGVLLAQQGKDREALTMFERGVRYAAEAYGKAPQSVMWGRWLCIGLRNVASKYKQFGQHDDALQSFRRAVVIRRKLAFENPAIASLKAELHRAWVDLAKHQRTSGDEQAAVRSFRAAREVLENIPRNTPDETFELAVVYGALAQPSKESAELPDEDREIDRQQNADDAMIWLRKAVEAGYEDIASIRSNKSLTAVRERDDFQKLIKGLEAARLAATEPGGVDEKLADRREAVNVLQELIGSGPAEVRHRKTLASALHSIGVIQTDLKQFDEAQKTLEEALQLRREVLDESDPRTGVDKLATESALGTVQWHSNRQAVAHKQWQRILSELAEITKTHQDDAELMRSVADIERSICNWYGRLGLWELAATFSVRNVHLERVNDRNHDAWQAAVLPLVGNSDAFRVYSHLLHASLEQALSRGEEQRSWELASFVQQSCILPDPSVSTDQLVSIAQQALELEPDTKWLKLTLVMAFHRNGRHQEMLDLAAGNEWGSGNTPSTDRHHWLVCAYLRVLAHLKLQHADKARALFNAAEECYRQYCREAVEDAEPQFPAPINANWWWFAWSQQLRREAWIALHLEASPADPWSHLIQARGYRLIGETEKAEQELAAASATAAKDEDLWISMARLGSSEDAWDKAFDRCESDLRVLIERGRWHAERGEQEQADADFARAIAPGPDGRPTLAATPFSPQDAHLHQQAWAEYLELPVELENSIGMKFRLIPPGVFQMGTPLEFRQQLIDDVRQSSPAGIQEDWVKDIENEPLTRVMLTQPVYAGQFEVTVSDFRRFVEESDYLTEGERTGFGGYAHRNGWKRHPSHIWKSPAKEWTMKDAQPVVHISWRDAVAFCEWLSLQENRSYSLPTEAQWEFACRGGSQTLYGEGDDPSVLERNAWSKETLHSAGLRFAQQVGLKDANAFGLHDMLGNAEEWCLDRWGPGIISDVPLVDPFNHTSSDFRVIRGGCWIQTHTHSRCGGRHGPYLDIFDCTTGFRVWLKIDAKESDDKPLKK